MTSRARRGFSTLPLDPQTDDHGLDISGDFMLDDAALEPEASSDRQAKRKAGHPGDDRRDSATPAATPARKAKRPGPAPKQKPDNDADDESDASGDIFTGDTRVVASNQTYAHHLKKKLGYSHEEFPNPSGRGVVKARRVPAQDDPENHAIKNLRVNEKLSWADITTLINQERVRKGAVPDLTLAATYSRFVRNAPRIAAQEGETEFDVQDYMYMKPKEMGKLDQGASGTPDAGVGKRSKRKWSRKADEILVSSYRAAKEEFWMVVAEKFELQSGRPVTPADCAERFKLL